MQSLLSTRDLASHQLAREYRGWQAVTKPDKP